MSPHSLLLKRFIWFQMLLVAGFFVMGVLYAVAYWIDGGVVLLVFVNPALVVIGGLFAIITALGILEFSVKIVFPRLSRKPVSVELKERLWKLAVETLRRMNANPRVQFVVGKRSSLAYVRKNRIVVGDRLLLVSSDEEIIGLIGHEIGHVLKRHAIIKGLASLATFIAFMAVFVAAGESDFSVRLAVTTVAGFALAGIPLNWRLEYTADRVAAERLGASAVARTLERLRTINYDGVSFSHPPLSKRIRRIRSLSITPLITHVYG